MKRFQAFRGLIPLIFLLSSSGCAGTNQQGYAGASMYSGDAVSPFYDELSPYGRWVSLPYYGRVWAPLNVDAGWRPYTDGYWAYSDYGWTWASYEPWGWATYHYGRWFLDPIYGWTWVPDTVWGPSWVAWRYGDDWAGWAPLPPSTSWSVSTGLNGTSTVVERIPASQWSFVEGSHLLDRNIGGRIVPATSNGALLGRTRNVTSFGARGGRAVNRSLDLAVVEQVTRSRPQRIPVETALAPRPSVSPPGLRPSPTDEQKHLDAFLGGERERLRRAQSDEFRAARTREQRDALRRSHRVETQAFEQQAAQQRQALTRGIRPAYIPFDRTAVRIPPEPKGQDNARGSRGRQDGGN